MEEVKTMGKLLLRLLGRRVVHKAVAKQAGRGRVLDVGFGFALLRDRRVAPGVKLLALILGTLLVGWMVALELPLEGVCATLLPILGFGLDSIVDGMEVLIGPLLFGALLLPFLAPKPLVERLRAERRGFATGPTGKGGPIIDVESTPLP